MSQREYSVPKRPGRLRTGDDRGVCATRREDLCVAICHDVKGPLATARAAIDEFLRGCPSRESSPHLHVARRGLTQANELLATLPLLLRRSEGGDRPLDLGSLLAVVRADVELELRLCRGTMRVVRPLPRVLGNPDRLRIALRNLIQNAIRHRRPRTRPDVTVRAWIRARVCTITISDNGLGLSTNRARAMERTGAGLAIARQGVESSGGTLAFRTRPGIGTTVAVTLRAAASAD